MARSPGLAPKSGIVISSPAPDAAMSCGARSCAQGGAIIADAACMAVRSPRPALRSSRDHCMTGRCPSVRCRGYMGIAALQHKTVALPQPHGSWPGKCPANPQPGPIRGTYCEANPNKLSGIACYAGFAPGDQAGAHRRTDGCDFAFNGLSGGVGGGC